MSTFQYIPASLAYTLEDVQILRIDVCAYKAGRISASAVAGNPKTNHWTLYCVISEENSVRVDPTPTGSDFRSIVLAVSQKAYANSINAVKRMELKVHGLKTRQFLNMIKINNYDKYQFSSGGQGCRFWIYSVIKFLESKGHVLQSDAGSILDALGMVWADNGVPASASEQTPMAQGRFYTQDQVGPER